MSPHVTVMGIQSVAKVTSIDTWDAPDHPAVKKLAKQKVKKVVILDSIQLVYPLMEQGKQVSQEHQFC